MNEFIFLLEIVAVFSALLFCYSCFGKYGLYTWVCFATIFANIQVCKQVTLFGMDVTLGNVLFGSTFLATDILDECYDFKSSKRAVFIGIYSVAIFLLFSQITLLYIPNTLDYVNNSFENIFSLSIRVSLSSAIMYFIANICDVYIFDALKKKYPKLLFIRNNVSTILCNCLENFLFTIGAFLGIYDITTCLSIAVGTSIIEIIIAICDTPFLYLAKRIRPREDL